MYMYRIGLSSFIRNLYIQSHIRCGLGGQFMWFSDIYGNSQTAGCIVVRPHILQIERIPPKMRGNGVIEFPLFAILLDIILEIKFSA